MRESRESAYQLLRRQEDLAPRARKESNGSSEDGDAADESGVLGRGQGLISRGNEAFGGAATALLAVDSLGRHCEFAEEVVRIRGDEAQSVMGRSCFDANVTEGIENSTSPRH